MANDDKEELAALRAEIARLAAQQKASSPSPAIRRRTTLYAVVVAIAALVFGAAYFGSPFLALHDLQRAARDGDGDRLEQLVDFPKVRENLKSKVDAYVLQSMRSDPNMANNPFAGLGALIVPAVADRAIDTYVTPDGIAAVVNNGTTPKLNASDAAPQPYTAAAPPRFSPSFVDLDHFKVALSRSDAPASKLTLVLERHGLFGWKLTRIDFDFPPASSAPAVAPPSSQAATQDAASANGLADANSADGLPQGMPSAADMAAYAVFHDEAEAASFDYLQAHPEASVTDVSKVAAEAARRSGDPNAEDTGLYAAEDARDWAATARVDNSSSQRTSPAELAAIDAAADAADRRASALFAKHFPQAPKGHCQRKTAPR